MAWRLQREESTRDCPVAQHDSRDRHGKRLFSGILLVHVGTLSCVTDFFFVVKFFLL